MGSLTKMEHRVKSFGYAARDTSGVLSPFNFSRRETGDEDVRLKVLYCGICHSDLHIARNDFHNANYPVVPGHEIVGVVTEIGTKVKTFKVGERVGVGFMIGSCRSCEHCVADLNQYCPKLVLTYNDPVMGTYGGYSDHMVVNQDYIISWPENFPLDRGAPLLCAGITLYSPLKYYGLDKPGMHIGIVGLGGLGHVGVKFAKAFGVKVTVISTSPNKKEEAINNLGADSFLLSHDQAQMQAAVGTMDGVIDTVAADHSIGPLINLLKPYGKLVVVGVPIKPLELPVIPMVMGRKMVGASLAGGIKETQEMIDFAAKHNITAEVEVIPINYVNTAMQRLEKADVRYRFVIDIANTL
uniref:probable mannitol dehydrogenase n=1 Tax=Erigeron canadensis TaxID=72917 RepID=UPI001CB9B6DE|nr:probable mannitol dehydrogenase [Erigeron canadensis]